MSIFITGDLHARLDIAKLFSRNFDARGLNKNDYVIICGDFGLIWNERAAGKAFASKQEKTLDWLDSKPYTVLFIDGNHEDFDLLNAYPVEIWHGGKVHKIRDNVIHLMRGQIFDIDGNSFLSLGGAISIDKDMRYAGVDWWPDEKITDADIAEAQANLEKYGNHVDYVLTHDAPTQAKYALQLKANASYRNDDNSDRLQWLADQIDFDEWFFGHFHEDFKHIGFGGKYTALYNLIYDLDEHDWSDRISIERIVEANDLPAPANPRGYTFSELADIAKIDVDSVRDAIKYDMICATMGIDDDGNSLVYRCDVMRILNWC